MNSIKILSHILDHRIKAINVIIEISILEYLEIAEEIINENDFQRKKVINSQISALLKEDIIIGCSIPPLVLAIKQDLINDKDFDYNSFTDLTIVEKAFESRKLLILDGKQRTHVFLQLYKELIDKKEKKDKKINGSDNFDDIEKDLKSFLANILRVEVYIGINKLNILYRMLTLNSGQTSMSTRHLMEMLYLDYLNITFDGIKLIPDKVNEPISNNSSEFIFKDVLDGFTSYLDKDENTLERAEILDNIKSAKNIKQEENDKFLFERFVSTYKKFIDKMVELANGYVIEKETLIKTEFEIKGVLFGKTPIEIFKRSQPLSGFGAAISELKDIRTDFTLETVNKLIESLNFREGNYERSILMLSKHFDSIRDKSKKIGNDQRFYFRCFFKQLFDPESSYPQSIDKAIDYAYKKTREEKSYLKDLNE